MQRGLRTMANTTPPLRIQDIEDRDLPIAYALLREAAVEIGASVTIDFGLSPTSISVRTPTGLTLATIPVAGKMSAAMREAAKTLRADKAA